ncbi:MAG: peptidoglycan DD-metalloendopeptidase family protein [Tepidanaerobacteraceae bacterium]|jgi:murein DD-endopeptidase MepM/ murein hydrolase activator NlpD
MYRFKWPFIFSSRPKKGKNNVNQLNDFGSDSVRKKPKIGKAILFILVIVIVGVNGVLWLFRATHGGFDLRGGLNGETEIEKEAQPNEWEINLNEQLADEQNFVEQEDQTGFSEMSETVQDNKGEISGQKSSETSVQEDLTKDTEEEKRLDEGQKTSAVVETLSDDSTQEIINDLATMAKPVAGKILKEYSVDSLVYSKTLQQWEAHYGIDIAAETGDAVKAVMEGTVIEVRKNDPRLGVVVVIEHGSGVQTLYGNLASTNLVEKGKYVKKNQVIGAVGNTSPYESQDLPHLHFEVIKDGEKVDPLQFLPNIN